MSWAIVATVGVSAGSSILASQSADKATEAADKASRRSLAFEQKKYDDWKNTYGGLEENLADYYTQLTPEMYIAEGLAAFQQEQEVALTNARNTLEQRGISLDSGVALAIESQAELQGAEVRAQIRKDAESEVMDAKQGFLQVGLGQNPSQGLSTALSNNAINAGNRATAERAAADQAISSTTSLITNQLLDYANKPTTPAVPTGNYGDIHGYA